MRFGIFQKTLIIMALVFAVPLANIGSVNLNATTERIAEQLSRGEFDSKEGGIGRGDETGALARAIERLGVSMQMVLNRLAGQT